MARILTSNGDAPEDSELDFVCCFCGKNVDDPVSVIVSWGFGDYEFQQWWAHSEHFVAALDESARELSPNFPR